MSGRKDFGGQWRRHPCSPSAVVEFAQGGILQMRYMTTLVFLSLLLGCGQRAPVTTPQHVEGETKELAAAKTPEERFYALDDAAKESFNAGKVEDAKKYAQELMALLPKYRGNWNYGNAVQDANLVLGRIAAREGRIDEAKRYLLEAGKGPGSPQMNTFGPNMSLAKDLLEKKEWEVVVKYFELCRTFWKMHDGRLDKWSQEAKDGKIPDFGSNLSY
jgi:hypothetical protein